MKNEILRPLPVIFSLAILLVFSNGQVAYAYQRALKTDTIRYDDTQKTAWEAGFEVVDILSTMDSSLQKAYFYKTTSEEPQPLIVSLHTWSGNYEQKDELAALAKSKNLNYIHPDFRGANNSMQACASEWALADIDDAISYAIENSNVDPSGIMVIGVSGGGYATLSTFMTSRHPISKFSAWASITDLAAWHNESKIRGNRYADNILDCTGSGDVLNLEKANLRSPLHWPTPVKTLKQSELLIYAGVYDGIQGSVPITHSINFYNKLLAEASVSDSSLYVSATEKLRLLEHRKPLGNYGSINGRSIFLQKKWGKVKLTIFEGNHEMLPAYALDELLQ